MYHGCRRHARYAAHSCLSQMFVVGTQAIPPSKAAAKGSPGYDSSFSASTMHLASACVCWTTSADLPLSNGALLLQRSLFAAARSLDRSLQRIWKSDLKPQLTPRRSSLWVSPLS